MVTTECSRSEAAGCALLHGSLVGHQFNSCSRPGKGMKGIVKISCQAKPDVGRPLDGRVRRLACRSVHHLTSAAL